MPSLTLSRAFAFDLTIITLLVFLALGNAASPAWPWFPFEWPSFAFEDVVPLWVPWSGALGGATISLVGVATKSDVWDPRRYGWWHLSRPFLGAVSGTFAVLILVFVLASITPSASDVGYGDEGIAVLTVVAFVVGYREATFRELVKRVVDLLLKPAAEPMVERLEFGQLEAAFGSVTVGTPKVVTVNLVNHTTRAISVSPSDLGPLPGDLTVTAPASTLEPGSIWDITMEWTPVAPGVLHCLVALRGQVWTSTLRVTGEAVAPIAREDPARPGDRGGLRGLFDRRREQS